MSPTDCPYCLRRSRLPSEPTCGTLGCVNQHIATQLERALEDSDAAVAPEEVFEVRGPRLKAGLRSGYHCDSCGHDQEEDVACKSCGHHGVIPFGFSDDNETRFELRDGSIDPISGLDPEAWKLLRAVEALTRQHGLARAQQVLAQALWRCSVGHPALQMTVDFDTSSIVLRDGGRDIRAEIRFFPPGLPALKGVR